jgi:hypothetical protein
VHHVGFTVLMTLYRCLNSIFRAPCKSKIYVKYVPQNFGICKREPKIIYSILKKESTSPSKHSLPSVTPNGVTPQNTLIMNSYSLYSAKILLILGTINEINFLSRCTTISFSKNSSRQTDQWLLVDSSCHNLHHGAIGSIGPRPFHYLVFTIALRHPHIR